MGRSHPERAGHGDRGKREQQSTSWLLNVCLRVPRDAFAQSLSCIWLSVTQWTVAHQVSLSFTLSRACSNSCPLTQWFHPIISFSCLPLLLLPSIFPRIRVFPNESVLHIRWPLYWNFSFSISPSNGYSGLMPFKIDWLDLLAVQGTLKCLLQQHSSKASILWCSAFFMVQLSHPYVTTEKTIISLDGPLLAK